jgi:hypothetical protein
MVWAFSASQYNDSPDRATAVAVCHGATVIPHQQYHRRRCRNQAETTVPTNTVLAHLISYENLPGHSFLKRVP